MSPAEHSFPAQHFSLALEAAVRAGTDTDTVAAIAGALLGARWGCSGIPLEWQQAVHGWPGHTTGADLVRLAGAPPGAGATTPRAGPRRHACPLAAAAASPYPTRTTPE
ncbi:ADP-ribosylglycohydrolase family protein [Streptomyces sp. NPDC018036]|uniref:ADP-ribosylglycohydrolase family protein n=1 Tax=Streptomyces sp. NPDC018036 TaxID=3365035 RepID=UPI0037A75A75